MAIKIKQEQAEKFNQIQRQREADANEAPRLRARLMESDAEIAQLKVERANAHAEVERWQREYSSALADFEHAQAEIVQLKAELASAREAAAFYDPDETARLRVLLAGAHEEATRLSAELAKNVSVARSKYIAALSDERDAALEEVVRLRAELAAEQDRKAAVELVLGVGSASVAPTSSKVSTYMDRLEAKPSTGGTAPPCTDPRVDALCRVLDLVVEAIVTGKPVSIQNADLETIAGRR